MSEKRAATVRERFQAAASGGRRSLTVAAPDEPHRTARMPLAASAMRRAEVKSIAV